MALAFLASLPMILVGWFALPWVVTLLIPKYVGAIPMMRVTLLTMPITFLSLPISILWATGRLMDCFWGVIAGFLTFLCLSGLLFWFNIGVLSILIASMLGQAIVALVTYLLILRLIRHEKQEKST
jgi:O-antigen/teichoic acid export membrane protein